ncbi:MAG: HD domain-containing protein [Patescibacteria group bacterium]
MSTSQSFSERREALLAFVKRAHAGQARCGGYVPTWHHLDRVSRLLESVLWETGEGTEEEREAIALAGLGHDILEDTEVSDEEVRRQFGDRAFQLISGMTNKWGDKNTGPYIENMCRSEESVRLIKLSDLYDNCTSAAQCLFTLGTTWAREFLIPIVKPMSEAVLKTDFMIYPRTAERMKALVQNAYRLLEEEVARYEQEGRAVQPEAGKG